MWGQWGERGCCWQVSQHNQELEGCTEQDMGKQVEEALYEWQGGENVRGESQEMLLLRLET